MLYGNTVFSALKAARLEFVTFIEHRCMRRNTFILVEKVLLYWHFVFFGLNHVWQKQVFAGRNPKLAVYALSMCLSICLSLSVSVLSEW